MAVRRARKTRSRKLPKRDPKRKAQLLAAFVDYVLENGLSDLSLRPAAAALGTSPPIFLYYFGSKEKLIAEAIAEARTRELGLFAREIARARRGTSASEALWRVWRWFSSTKRAPFTRLFFEVWALAIQRPERFAKFLEVGRDFFATVADAFVAGGFSRAESQTLATFYLDSLRGLLLDLFLTGDRARIDKTVKLIDRLLQRDLRRARPK